MSKQKLERTLRHTRKHIRIGLGSICEQCGEHDVRALCIVRKQILCSECRLRHQGKQPFEHHHVAGRANDTFSIRIPANDHSLLSDAQQDWPITTLRNQQEAQLIKIAAMLRGSQDFYLHVIQHAPEWARFLEHIEAYLADRIGPDWSSDYEQWREQHDE